MNQNNNNENTFVITHINALKNLIHEINKLTWDGTMDTLGLTDFHGEIAVSKAVYILRCIHDTQIELGIITRTLDAILAQPYMKHVGLGDNLQPEMEVKHVDKH